MPKKAAEPTLDPKLTEFLNRWADGDAAALKKAFPQIYAELLKLSQWALSRSQHGVNLDPPGLVHEAYMRLLKANPQGFKNRRYFFAYASTIIRGILIDKARAAAKEGQKADITVSGLAQNVQSSFDVLRVDLAIDKLAEIDATLAQVVEMKFFGGLKEDEMAEALDVSSATVGRYWATARAWLSEELR